MEIHGMALDGAYGKNMSKLGWRWGCGKNCHIRIGYSKQHLICPSVVTLNFRTLYTVLRKSFRGLVKNVVKWGCF